MKRVLIVNADDCNLTPGVTRAILDCHDRGILTSTTFMANLPVRKETVRELLKRKNLGVGIHLNVTFGTPLSKPAKIKSLLGTDGLFRPDLKSVGAPLAGARSKNGRGQAPPLPVSHEVTLEYQAQIDRFTEVFGRKPTHLDTHHQVHDHPFFLKVLCEAAEKNALPVRKSSAMFRHFRMLVGWNPKACGSPAKASGDDFGAVRTTDFFFGNLSPEGYWTREPLTVILQNLPSGVSEIMCHPGRHDKALEAVSSFREGRQKEWELLRSSFLRTLVKRAGIVPAHFGCAILQ